MVRCTVPAQISTVRVKHSSVLCRYYTVMILPMSCSNYLVFLTYFIFKLNQHQNSLTPLSRFSSSHARRATAKKDQLSITIRSLIEKMPAGVAELTHNHTEHTASSMTHTGNPNNSQINYILYFYTGKPTEVHLFFSLLY